jgi:hypothetical protein
MKELLFNNLAYIGIAFCIFALCVVANITIKTYFNTCLLNQGFSISKMTNGIIKMLSIGITTALLAVIVTLVPAIPFITWGDTATDIFCIGSVILLYGEVILKYFKEAYTATRDILNNRNIIDDIEIIEEVDDFE